MEFKDLKVGDLFLDAGMEKLTPPMHDVLTVYRKDSDHALSGDYGNILIGAWGQGGKATFPMNGKVIKLV